MHYLLVVGSRSIYFILTNVLKIRTFSWIRKNYVRTVFWTIYTKICSAHVSWMRPNLCNYASLGKYVVISADTITTDQLIFVDKIQTYHLEYTQSETLHNGERFPSQNFCVLHVLQHVQVSNTKLLGLKVTFVWAVLPCYFFPCNILPKFR